ncbi:hypothetical protein P8452_28258 [Trifolium repens]|nr:hypothetical protein P8452_28258 [Trifolium repens]
MAPEPNRTGAGASTSGTAKDEAAAKKKIESEDLSDEDLALKQQLELYVERVQDSDPGLQKVALESMRQEIRTSTSSMTSVPKPLKFLRPHYGTLKAYYETMAESELKKYLADILSVLALTMSAEGERESLKYRLLGSEGSSSSSASSSSSDSGSDDNEDDDDMKDEDGAASDSDEEKMMVSWSPTVDVDVDFDEEDVVVGPIRSKNEIQNLPPVPPVDVTLEPHHKMVPIGVVMSTLGAQVIVEGVEKHEPLNEGSILWLTESRKPLGLVDEIFGPVKNPYYIVRYNSESEVPAGIQGGTTLVSCVPEFADRVLNNKDLYRKGYDASGANDEELSDEVEFSDDEKEAEYRKMQKMTKRGVNDQNPGKRKNNKKKFSPRDNRYLPGPDDLLVLDIAYSIYLKFEEYPNALQIALFLDNLQHVRQVFTSCDDVLRKKQFCYILARHGITFELDEEMVNDDEDREVLQDIINNSKLSEGYLTLARDIEVMEPKSPEDIYKAHLLDGRASAGASVDSARQNLAATFVNAFVNAGFGQDKLMTVASDSSSSGSSGNWLFKNKERGKTSAAASLV